MHTPGSGGVEHAFDEFERSFRQQHPAVWIMTIICPFVLSSLAVATVYVWAGPAFTARLLSVCLLTFLFFGRFVILAGHTGDLNDIGEFMTSEQLFAVVMYMDVMVAMLVAFHIGVLFKIPFVGPRVAELVADGNFVLSSYPRIKRVTFVGLMIFVAFPLAATGSVGGSILGRLLGMSRLATFVATLSGCLLGNGLMYVASDFINRYVDKDHPVVQLGGIASILGVIGFLEWRYRKMKALHVS